MIDLVYHDLRDFISQLEQMGELKRIKSPVSPYLEMTELCDRTLCRRALGSGAGRDGAGGDLYRDGRGDHECCRLS